MSGKIFVWLLTTVLLTTAPAAEAQQTKKVARIGVLSQSNANFMSTQLEAFRQGLRAFGYVEGQNIAIEYRYAEGKLDRLPDLAVELVRLKVDVIAATSTPAVLAAKNTTKEIPIVFHTLGDPVASGVVASLAQPGANITGLTMGGAELDGKRLGASQRHNSQTLPCGDTVESSKFRDSTEVKGNAGRSAGFEVAAAIPGGAKTRGYRASLRCRNPCKNRCVDCNAGPTHHE